MKLLRNSWQLRLTSSTKFTKLLILTGLLLLFVLITRTQYGTEPFIDYQRNKLKFIYPEVIQYLYQNRDENAIDWLKLAYVFYAVTETHLCNSMMLISQLKKYRTRAQFVILLNEQILIKIPHEIEQHQIDYGIVFKPIQVENFDDAKDSYWTSSSAKLKVFELFEYDRIIYMDSDSTLPRGNLDELFFVPPVELATVNAYWLTKDKYKVDKSIHNARLITEEDRRVQIDDIIEKLKSSRKKGLLGFKDEKNYYNKLYNSLPNFERFEHFFFASILMVIKPSEELNDRVLNSFEKRKSNDFDMDMLNYYIFKPINSFKRQLVKAQNGILRDDIPELLILPHQIYGTLTREFSIEEDHRAYLADPHDQGLIHSLIAKGSYFENTTGMTENVKYLHFSNTPLPKPWVEFNPYRGYMKERLRCKDHKDFRSNDERLVKPKKIIEDCDSGEYWERIHQEFRISRKQVCGLDLIKVPDQEDPYAHDDH